MPVELTAAALLGVEPERLRAALEAAGCNGPSLSLRTTFELAQAAQPCAAAPDGSDLLLGWLSSVGDDEGDPAHAGVHSSEHVGLLRLTCQRSSVVCSVSRAADAWPESFGRLIAVASWTYVPEIDADSPHLEIDGELITLLPPRTPPPKLETRAFSVREMVRRSEPQKMLRLRGEVTAISEVTTSNQHSSSGFEGGGALAGGERGDGAKRPKKEDGPYFFVELSQGSGGGGVAVVVAFRGVRACRWRYLLRVGEEYLLSNLRQAVLFEGRPSEQQVLRTSDDQSRAQTHVWRAPPSDAAPPPRRRRRLRTTNCSQLLAQASQCGGYELSQGALLSVDDEGEGEGEDEAGQRHELIDYEGEVSQVLSPLVWELDGQFKLFLSHAPPHPRPGARRGARVLVHAAHTLPHAAAEAAAAQAPGCAIAGFGLCWRGHVEITRHASLPPPATAAAPTAAAAATPAACITRKLFLFLNLPEVVDYWEGLHPRWAERWDGILPSRRGHQDRGLSAAALLQWLLKPQPTSPCCPPVPAAAGAAATAAAAGLLRNRPLREGFREVYRHSRGCAMCASRGPLPHAPPLDELLGHRRLQEARQRAAQSHAPQLLRREALGGAGGCLPPLLLGQLWLSEDPDRPALLLRDATAAMPLLLPPADACRADALGDVVCASAYELLVEPPPRRAPQTAQHARVFVRLRLFDADGLAAPGVRMLPFAASGGAPAPRRVRADAAARGGASAGGEPLLLVPTSGLRVIGAAAGGAASAERGVTFVAQASAPGWKLEYGPAAAGLTEARVTLSGARRRWLPLLQPFKAFLVWGGHHFTAGHVRVDAADAELALLPPSPEAARFVGAPPPPLLSICELLQMAPRLGPDEPVAVLRCVLLERRLKDEEQSWSLQLRLGDGRGATVEAYLDLDKVGVPPGLRVGSWMRLCRAWARTSHTKGQLYLKLDTDTEVSPRASRACTRLRHPAARLTTALAHQVHLEEGDEAAAAVAAGSEEEAMAAMAPTPLSQLVQGHGRQGGIHRLHVSLRKVFSLELRWRCASCGDVMRGRICGCAQAFSPAARARPPAAEGGGAPDTSVWGDGRSRLFEVQASAEISDGGAHNALYASGAQALELLQCSGATVEALRRAAAACGPLSHSYEWRGASDLSAGTAQWRSGAGQAIDATSRLALERIVPPGLRWHRDFVVYCRVTRRAGGAWKREAFTLAGEPRETYVPETRVTLQALRVTPINAALEVHRLLMQE